MCLKLSEAGTSKQIILLNGRCQIPLLGTEETGGKSALTVNYRHDRPFSGGWEQAFGSRQAVTQMESGHSRHLYRSDQAEHAVVALRPSGRIHI
jgi:hypothetical protein